MDGRLSSAWYSSRIACDRAELEHGLAARFGGRHAGAEILRRLLREVFFHLFAQTLIAAAAG